jgi:hypothetical protein
MTRHAEQRDLDERRRSDVLGGGAELDPSSRPHPESMGGGVQDPAGTKRDLLCRRSSSGEISRRHRRFFRV